MQDTTRTPSTVVDLVELERYSLEAALVERGHPRFRSRQVFRWLYRRGADDVGAMTDLPLDLRSAMAREFGISTPAISAHDRSSDGTEKFLLQLGDGRQVESVFIPDTPAMTFCISTQVGCAVACTFCLTGKMGLVRNLTAGEITGQVRVLARSVDLGGRAFNIVFMGMGEPLHNYDETMKAVRILADPHGFALPPRRMTLSTVGLVPALERLAHEPIMPNLAISLHAPTDAERAALVPLNRKYPIAAVIDACRRLPLRKRSRVTFEYVLLAGVNDSPEAAVKLARVVGSLKSKVNVIPLNAAPGIPYERPSDAVIDRFARTLAEHGVLVSVRKSRGRDIRAACGQLIVEGQKPSPGQRLATLAFGE